MKIAFICELPNEHFWFWQDGLSAAIDYLSTQYKWEIDVFNLPSLKNPNLSAEKINSYDFGLYWGPLNRKQHEKKLFRKQGLCYAGGPTNHVNADNFDIIFAESRVDLDEFTRLGKKAHQAFGTNTKLFKPIQGQPKVIDCLYPAAFAKWKRHDEFVDYVIRRRGGEMSIAVGYIQPNNHEYECVEVCLNNNIGVIPWIPASSLVWLYNGAKEVVVAADPVGGCQRTVLEAIACGTPVKVLNQEHKKLTELQNLTREEVLKDWSEVSYAEALKYGIEDVINRSGQHLTFNPGKGLTMHHGEGTTDTKSKD